VPEALELSFDEVVRAGRVLFGPAFAARGRWRDGLRSAFRRRALETHPDRALALGRDAAELSSEFAAVADAYRALSELRVVPPPPPRAPPRPRPRPRQPWPQRARRPSAPAAPSARTASPAPAPPSARTAPSAPAAPSARTASSAPAAPFAPTPPSAIPPRRLRLAEFLYYSGRVPWSAFIEAIARQRRERPPVGSIAVGFGFLTSAEVTELLARRLADAAYQVPFGEYAVQEGYLTPFQLLATLGRQLRLQRPIGQYFVEQGLVGEPELDALRRRMYAHNLRWR